MATKVKPGRTASEGVAASGAGAKARGSGVKVTRPSGGDFFTSGTGPFTFEVGASGALVIKKAQGEAAYAFAPGQWLTANAF